MIGQPFDEVGSTNGVSVQDLFTSPLTSGFTGGAIQANADNMMFWTGTSYTTLYLYDSTLTTTLANLRRGKWMNPGLVPSTATWGAIGQISQKKVIPGEAFYLKRLTYSSSFDVVVKGQVVTAISTKDRTIVEGWNLIAGSFTSIFDPNTGGIDWLTQGAVGGAIQANADNMMFWTGTSYTTLYLYDSTLTTTLANLRRGKWMNPGLVPSTATWGAIGQVSIYKHPVGQGFYYKRLATKGSFTLSQTQPYTL
jgi:hypothetical protein